MVRSKKDSKESSKVSSELSPDLANELKGFIRRLRQEYSPEKIKELFNKEVVKEDILKEAAPSVPIEIFDNSELSALEAIVKYLKEKDHSFKEIAGLLNRSEKTIWATFKNASRKHPERISIRRPAGPSISVPLTIFQDRKLSVLEALAAYLKEKEQLSFHEIAVLLNRDDRTIWTVYNRSKKKK